MTAPVRFDPYAELARLRSAGGAEVSQSFAAAAVEAKCLPGNQAARTFAAFAGFAEAQCETRDAASRPGRPAIDGVRRAGNPPWTADDWREYHEERIAVAMIDGEQPEAEARRIAWECCIVRWLDLHPVVSGPDAGCVACGKPDLPGAGLLPFGVEPPGAAWLHSRCWEAWYSGRRAEAASALAAAGITLDLEDAA